MQTKGKVEKVYDNIVEVGVIREGACGENCASCSGCTGRTVLVKAKCTFDVSVGDLVELTSDSKYIYIGLSLVFLLPVILPIVVYILFTNVFPELTVIVTTVSLLFSVFLLVLFSKSNLYIEKVTPSVTKVITKK